MKRPAQRTLASSASFSWLAACHALLQAATAGCSHAMMNMSGETAAVHPAEPWYLCCGAYPRDRRGQRWRPKLEELLCCFHTRVGPLRCRRFSEKFCTNWAGETKELTPASDAGKKDSGTVKALPGSPRHSDSTGQSAGCNGCQAGCWVAPSGKF